jgi:hypothetical protein
MLIPKLAEESVYRQTVHPKQRRLRVELDTSQHCPNGFRQFLIGDDDQ